jgi:hypothetical protein
MMNLAPAARGGGRARKEDASAATTTAAAAAGLAMLAGGRYHDCEWIVRRPSPAPRGLGFRRAGREGVETNLPGPLV